jgi:predicted PurR-regulated permease PerM
MTDDAPVAGAGRTGAGTRAQDSRAQDSRAAEERGNEAAENDRIGRGAGVQDQPGRGAGVREQNRLNAPGPGRPGKPEQARVPERGAGSPEPSRVPGWLQTGAAWSWRLLLLAAAVYLVARVLGVLYIVVVPCIAALLLTALLQPLTGRLRRAGLPALAATWATLLIAAVVLGGLVMLVANRVSADYPVLVDETRHTVTQIESLLAGPPFHVKSNSVQNFLNNIPGYLSKHKALVEGTVLTGGKIAAEFFGGLVLMLFVMFFLVKDGERIWAWLLGALRTDTAGRADRAGHAAWLAVVYYMRGTVAVAAIHAIVVGVVLSVMGVPLAFPLAVLVFVAAFVPLVGLLVAGALAILVTLATKGWVDAVILLGILIIEDQLEAHLLQPQVVGRAIRLHPLAVILALAVGGVLAGIAGAVVAVPIVAVITRAVPELRHREPGNPGPKDP